MADSSTYQKGDEGASVRCCAALVSRDRLCRNRFAMDYESLRRGTCRLKGAASYGWDASGERALLEAEEAFDRPFDGVPYASNIAGGLAGLRKPANG